MTMAFDRTISTQLILLITEILWSLDIKFNGLYGMFWQRNIYCNFDGGGTLDTDCRQYNT